MVREVQRILMGTEPEFSSPQIDLIQGNTRRLFRLQLTSEICQTYSRKKFSNFVAAEMQKMHTCSKNVLFVSVSRY